MQRSVYDAERDRERERTIRSHFNFARDFDEKKIRNKSSVCKKKHGTNINVEQTLRKHNLHYVCVCVS